MSRCHPRLLTAGVLACVLTTVPGCASVTSTDSANSYLIIDSLQGAAGVKPDTYSGTLASDVLTFVKKDIGGTQVLVPTIFEDRAQVTFRLGMKDPGTAANPTAPATVNNITVTQYHVSFVRGDGRNTPGVDVPYSFDGAITATVGATNAIADLTIVRIQAKSEAPLKALVGGNGTIAISTIAEITFYGKDQAGRVVSVTGRISVNFADWGDPS